MYIISFTLMLSFFFNSQTRINIFQPKEKEKEKKLPSFSLPPTPLSPPPSPLTTRKSPSPRRINCKAQRLPEFQLLARNYKVIAELLPTEV